MDFPACDIERFTECFAIAYGSGRLLLYDATFFMYTPNNYADLYAPLSNKCIDNFTEPEQIWPGDYFSIEDLTNR